MKHVLFALLLSLLYTPSSGQYDDEMAEYFFGRQPSPRAEAMGRSNVSLGGDLGSVSYNPASLGQLQGLQVFASSASPLYTLKDAQYTFIGAGYKLNKYLQFSIYNYTLDGNNARSAYDSVLARTEFISATNSLTLSTQPFKNLFFGMSANIFSYDVGEVQDLNGAKYSGAYNDTWIFDLGLLYELNLSENERRKHSMNFANSWKNISQAKAQFDRNGNEYIRLLPSTLYVGINYQYCLKTGLMMENANTLDFLAQVQYQDVLEYNYRDAFNGGAEVKLFEVFALRLGYYYETIDDRGFSEDNTNSLSEFTYGIGLQVPFHRFSKIPLNLTFNYASLSQPSYSKRLGYTDWGNFTSYAIGLTWVIDKKKGDVAPE